MSRWCRNEDVIGFCNGAVVVWWWRLGVGLCFGAGEKHRRYVGFRYVIRVFLMVLCFVLCWGSW